MAARRWIGLAVLLGAGAGAIAALIALGGRTPEPPVAAPPVAAPPGALPVDAARGAPTTDAARDAPVVDAARGALAMEAAHGGPAMDAPSAGEPLRGAASGAVRPASEPRSVPAEDRARADALVASARAELSAGRLARGRDLLVQAYALDPRPGTLLELGRVDLRAGRCRDARRAVQGLLATAPAPPLGDEARALLAEIGRCD